MQIVYTTSNFKGGIYRAVLTSAEFCSLERNRKCYFGITAGMSAVYFCDRFYVSPGIYFSGRCCRTICDPCRSPSVRAYCAGQFFIPGTDPDCRYRDFIRSFQFGRKRVHPVRDYRRFLWRNRSAQPIFHP